MRNKQQQRELRKAQKQKRDTIRVLYQPAGGKMVLRTIPNTLEACQELVGGYIECVTVCTDLLLICNEEGSIRDLPSNPFAGYDFRGDWFFCGKRGDEFADVPEGFIAQMRKEGRME